MGKAAKYLTRQAERLAVFLEDIRVPSHNNDAERDLRHVVVGRKNWLVFASLKCGEVACQMYSLTLTCKQNGVDPEACPAAMPDAVGTTPSSEIASLARWAWAKRTGAADCGAGSRAYVKGGPGWDGRTVTG